MYCETLLSLGNHNTLEAASTLQVKSGDTVLEIGTGSGYQTAVLCLLGAKVYSIERQQELFKKTSKFLPKLGYRAKIYTQWQV